ncbi:MAG: PEP-CTERM sorting domain-containing protein [Planctomycetes bacterium]|nr:PEP-CTERM sorting domain-containing protein [Planctomycetota bacterium]
MKCCKVMPFALLLVTMVLVATADSAPTSLSIYDLQYTISGDGGSSWNGNVVDCLGGIVTHKFAGSKPKLTLQDPAKPDGWGGIQIKDWTGGTLFNNASVGDWVSVTNVAVEEYRGNTILNYDSNNSPSYEVVSTGNILPAPLPVSLWQIASPIEGPVGEFYVTGHSAEKYEAMRLTVEDVAVTAMDLGKAMDNYVLQGTGGSCWASDYMNAQVGSNYYHPYIAVGQTFQSVTGIIEQYTKVENGWDYYQLLTTDTSDLVVPEPASLSYLLAVSIAGGLRRRRRVQSNPLCR